LASRTLGFKAALDDAYLRSILDGVRY